MRNVYLKLISRLSILKQLTLHLGLFFGMERVREDGEPSSIADELAELNDVDEDMNYKNKSKSEGEK